MKRFLIGFIGLVGMVTLAAAPSISYTSYFNNIHVLTNATVIGDGTFSSAVSAGVLQATKAIRGYQGTLTHAGTVTLDFDATTTVNSLILTGDVTFAFSNLATNRTYRLRVINAQATNCAVIFPAGVNTATNWYGGKPVNYTAGRETMHSFEAWGSTDGDVKAAYSETE